MSITEGSAPSRVMACFTAPIGKPIFSILKYFANSGSSRSDGRSGVLASGFEEYGLSWSISMMAGSLPSRARACCTAPIGMPIESILKYFANSGSFLRGGLVASLFSCSFCSIFSAAADTGVESSTSGANDGFAAFDRAANSAATSPLPLSLNLPGLALEEGSASAERAANIAATSPLPVSLSLPGFGFSLTSSLSPACAVKSFATSPLPLSLSFPGAGAFGFVSDSDARAANKAATSPFPLPDSFPGGGRGGFDPTAAPEADRFAKSAATLLVSVLALGSVAELLFSSDI
mmetsp:Transcript_32155/g.94651  ORF Transcript_32155/g.94651 Transcript_32155/m.94651 type:complete len:291 (-) Transcript_32155:2832-3704(-)